MRRRAIAFHIVGATFAFGACTTSAARFESASGTGGDASSTGDVAGSGGSGMEMGGPDEGTHPTTVVGVTYRVDWDLAGAELDASGTGWSTVNDRGYRFTVTSATIVSHDLSLVPCPSGGMSGDDGTMPGSLGLGPVRLALGPPSARAMYEPDPSTVEAKLHEDFARPEPTSFGTRNLFPTTYCKAHYAIAGQMAHPSDPEGVDEPSIDVAGTWRPDGDDHANAIPFTVRVTWANGIILPLPAPQEGQLAGGVADITMVRAIGTLFDGVDPSDGVDDADQRLVFSNLVGGTHVEMTF